MKPTQKGLVLTLTLAAAGLTVWSAAAGRQREAAPVEPAPSGPEKTAAVTGETAGTAAKVADTAAPDEAPAAVIQDEPVPAPADLRVTVRDTRQGRILKVQRQGHLMAVRGASLRAGMHEVVLPAPAAGSGGTFVWESTSSKTLETLRGQVILSADGSIVIKNTVRVATITDEARPSHVCRGHADGAGGFVVLCRVDGPAAATSVDGNDPREGVWSLAGDRTLVRLDLPMTGDGARAKVLGYEKGGKGVLVRVEASRAPGETAAILAIGSDARSQPAPVQPRGCFCRLPIDDRL